MKKNITYLIGAGASVGALPLYIDITDRLIAFKNYIEINKDSLENEAIISDGTTLVKSIDWLLRKIEDYGPIDNFAGELSGKKDQVSINELDKVKKILGAFFTFEQLLKEDNEAFYRDEWDYSLPPSRLEYDDEMAKLIRRQIDPRYTAFYNEVLIQKDDVKKLPENVKIISWNYDLQFELGYCRKCDCFITEAQKNLQVFPSKIVSPDLTKSAVIKLNGTAGLFFNKEERGVLDSIIFHHNKPLKEHLFEILNVFSDRWSSQSEVINAIYFGFRNEPLPKQARQIAKRILSETETLVIVGYSFPSTNKIVDREIFSEAKKIGKIFYQVPKVTFEGRSNRIEKLNSDFTTLIEHYPDMDNFCYPD